MKKIFIAFFILFLSTLQVKAEMLDVDYNFIDTAFDGIKPITNKEFEETINKLTRIQRQLIQELGREPTAEEIADKMDGMTPEKVREIQKISLEPVSLETPIGEEDDSHLGDFIEDEQAMSPDDYAANELLKDELNEVLLELTDREEKVLRLRFGLDDGRTRTLEEVGKEFNVTRERIRQIEAKALRKLKHPSRSKRLRDFLDK